MISLSGMVNVKIPIHLHIFLQICVVFANMDIFNGEGFYDEHMVFKETEPIGEKWAFFKYDNMNFMLNSGSYFVILLGIFAYEFALYCINKVCTWFPKKPLARKIGVSVYKDSYIGSSVDSTLKLFLESYFDGVICTSINITAFIKTKNNDELLEFFTGRDNLICSIITITHVFFVLFFPIYSNYLIKNNQGNFKKMDGLLAILLEGENPYNYYASMNTFYFLLRRFLTGIGLVIFVDWPYF